MEDKLPNHEDQPKYGVRTEHIASESEQQETADSPSVVVEETPAAVKIWSSFTGLIGGLTDLTALVVFLGIFFINAFYPSLMVTSETGSSWNWETVIAEIIVVFISYRCFARVINFIRAYSLRKSIGLGFISAAQHTVDFKGKSVDESFALIIGNFRAEDAAIISNNKYSYADKKYLVSSVKEMSDASIMIKKACWLVIFGTLFLMFLGF